MTLLALSHQFMYISHLISLLFSSGCPVYMSAICRYVTIRSRNERSNQMRLSKFQVFAHTPAHTRTHTPKSSQVFFSLATQFFFVHFTTFHLIDIFGVAVHLYVRCNRMDVWKDILRMERTNHMTNSVPLKNNETNEQMLGN